MTEQNFEGRFVWRELMTTDANKAKGYYGELFNWTSNTVEMGEMGDYTLLKREGEDVGGVMIIPEAQQKQVPAHWVSYITVNDLAAKVEQVKELGGEVHVGPIDIPVGSFAIVSDPNGASFALFKSNTPGATDTESRPQAGEFCWEQLMTRDLDKSVEFYTNLFGWTSAPMGEDTVVFSTGEQQVATAMTFPKEAEGMHPHWLTYVNVDDVDASTDKARKLGGQVYKEPTDIPGMGRFSVLADPTGAAFALWYHAN